MCVHRQAATVSCLSYQVATLQASHASRQHPPAHARARVMMFPSAMPSWPRPNRPETASSCRPSLDHSPIPHMPRFGRRRCSQSHELGLVASSAIVDVHICLLNLLPSVTFAGFGGLRPCQYGYGSWVPLLVYTVPLGGTSCFRP
jgi:hypothetical protein